MTELLSDKRSADRYVRIEMVNRYPRPVDLKLSANTRLAPLVGLICAEGIDKIDRKNRVDRIEVLETSSMKSVNHMQSVNINNSCVF